MWSVRCRALSYARPPVLGARGRGPLPTGFGCGACGRGDPSPTQQCVLVQAGFARCGGGMRASGGGAPLAWVWGVRAWALSQVKPPVFGTCSRGPLPTGCGLGVCGRCNLSPTPQRALLRAGFGGCGGGTRVPGGGASCLGVGHPGVGTLLRPTARPWGVRPGPGPHWLWVRGGWVWGPITNPTARAIACWLCALWGLHEGARGGRGFLAWVWSVQGWALSYARLPVLGACSRGPLPTGCGCGWCGRGDPSPTPQRARASWLCALWERHEGFRGGGHLLPGCGTPGVERSPWLNRPSLRRAAGARYSLAVGAGVVGVGTCHQPHSARSCKLALHAVGVVRGCRGGGRLLPRQGASGMGRSPTPDRSSLGRAAGACYPLAVDAVGVAVRTRHQTHSACSCELALHAVQVA